MNNMNIYQRVVITLCHQIESSLKENSMKNKYSVILSDLEKAFVKVVDFVILK